MLSNVNSKDSYWILTGARDVFEYIIDATKKTSDNLREDSEDSSQDSTSSKDYLTADDQISNEEMDVNQENNSEPMDTSIEEMDLDNHQFDSTSEVERLQRENTPLDNVLTKKGSGSTKDKTNKIYKNKKTGVEFEVEKMPFSNNM